MRRISGETDDTHTHRQDITKKGGGGGGSAGGWWFAEPRLVGCPNVVLPAFSPLIGKLQCWVVKVIR